LGPQIRDFAAVINEVDSDVAICPLSSENRDKVKQYLEVNPTAISDFYNKYKDFGCEYFILFVGSVDDLFYRS
jgi:uncharacterized protein with NRDE domain